LSSLESALKLGNRVSQCGPTALTARAKTGSGTPHTSGLRRMSACAKSGRSEIVVGYRKSPYASITGGRGWDAPALAYISLSSSFTLSVVNPIGACLAGAGIARVMIGVRDLLANGLLVDLLPDWPGQAFPLYALCPAGPHPAAKIRAFIDFVLNRIGRQRRSDQQLCA
jgi:hypothetical protein